MVDYVSARTARRYVLGRQGLWPGRRAQGKTGTAHALSHMETVQIDPISVLHRSHDLTLHSRVSDYDPAHLDALLYTDRAFFDYGTILMIYPVRDLPYFVPIMERIEAGLHRHTLHDVNTHVLEELGARGPLTSRDFMGRPRVAGGFNTVKDTGKALYHLYLGGTLMTHSRRRFERVFDRRENLFAKEICETGCTETDAEHHFARKALRDCGLATPNEWARRVSVYLHRRVTGKAAASLLETLVAEGAAARVGIEGSPVICYYPAEDAPLLHTLAHDAIPDAWTPLAADTMQEVTFLAPLDNVIWDRARCKSLFQFDYIWEVYKPEAARRWGYYTLPVLYGDQFVGRIFPRLDRKAKRLTIAGFWLENDALAHDTDFARALAAGLKRFARFHGAESVDVDTVPFSTLRAFLSATLPLAPAF